MPGAGSTRALRVATFAVVTAAACTSDEWPPPQDEGSSEGGDESTGVPIDGAHLEVFEPHSPSIHYIGESVPLLAEVHDDEGLLVGFTDIVWSADAVGPTLHVGPEADVELPPGLYDITASALLPNGDRLETTVGGVRVQTRWSGVYAGDVAMNIALDFMGFPVNQPCIATLDLTVDYDGEMVTIEPGVCTMETFIGAFEALITITGEFNNGVGQGHIEYDIGGFFGFGFDWTGAFVEDGFLGGFGGPTMLPLIGNADVTGSFDAPLATPYLEPG